MHVHEPIDEYTSHLRRDAASLQIVLPDILRSFQLSQVHVHIIHMLRYHLRIVYVIFVNVIYSQSRICCKNGYFCLRNHQICFHGHWLQYIQGRGSLLPMQCPLWLCDGIIIPLQRSRTAPRVGNHVPNIPQNITTPFLRGPQNILSASNSI
uniref:Uncharacterized protein n=1 Tax=Lepeophtheirus salmonis TaxID=72036 RepID=A0A0K2SZS5_LEPSM